MNEELLISLVRKYTVIYNYEDPNYHDDYHRSKIWNEIARTMNENPIACKEKWKKVRENYRKAIMIRKVKDSQVKKFKPIRYSKQLRFLKPYFKKECESLRKQPSITSDDEQSETSMPSTPEPSAVSTTSCVSAKTAYNKQKPVQEPPSLQSIENKFSHNQQEEVDPVVLFFRNLGQTVQQFPSDLQVRVKRDIFNIVNEAEEQFIQRNEAYNTNNITEYYYISKHE